jgi:hypothetical protein
LTSPKCTNFKNSFEISALFKKDFLGGNYDPATAAGVGGYERIALTWDLGKIPVRVSPHSFRAFFRRMMLISLHTGFGFVNESS